MLSVCKKIQEISTKAFLYIFNIIITKVKSHTYRGEAAVLMYIFYPCYYYYDDEIDPTAAAAVEAVETADDNVYILKKFWLIWISNL